jgi:hypothetical protein
MNNKNIKTIFTVMLMYTLIVQSRISTIVCLTLIVSLKLGVYTKNNPEKELMVLGVVALCSVVVGELYCLHPALQP